MKHCLYAPPFGTFGDVNLLVDLAGEAEQAGWDGFYLWDHVLFEQDVPFVDPWIALTAMACATDRIRLGPLVTPLARRRPWVVAREAVTLDHLSNGRLVLGVGLGIDFWREFSAFGEPATDDVARAKLVDDGIEIIQGLWSGEEISYYGDAHTVERVRFLPRPLQQPSIPIWSAAIFPMRHEGPVVRAARCDGVMPFGAAGQPTPDEVRGIRGGIEKHRTTDAHLDICLHGPPAEAKAYEAAGVDWYALSFWMQEQLDWVHDVIKAGPPAS
jgi:alkanesulfonate monooxygenase SsuD/methylene tetrahydromethanopterin reductase-like flavin-dependent oxidoreductase (luciferase family)